MIFLIGSGVKKSTSPVEKLDIVGPEKLPANLGKGEKNGRK
jgi:hypothetical protein